ncbi:hypothetical protein Dimus_037870 [Dionaea muscipula]
MSIPEYEAKFFELGRFAPEMLETEEDKMFLFERGLDPELLVHVRSHDCTTLTKMIQHAARLEDALMAARGSGQKRPRGNSDQSQSLSEGSKKKTHVGKSESSGGSTFRQWFCKRCGRHHSRGKSCDGRPLTCHSCGGQGHISAMCRSSGSRQHQGGQTQRGSEEATVQKPVQSASQASGGGRSVTVGSDRPLIPGRVYTLTQMEPETTPSDEQQ